MCYVWGNWERGCVGSLQFHLVSWSVQALTFTVSKACPGVSHTPATGLVQGVLPITQSTKYETSSCKNLWSFLCRIQWSRLCAWGGKKPATQLLTHLWLTASYRSSEAPTLSPTFHGTLLKTVHPTYLFSLQILSHPENKNTTKLVNQGWGGRRTSWDLQPSNVRGWHFINVH